MSKRTVAEVLVDELAEAGVTRLYGLVGDSLNPYPTRSAVTGASGSSMCGMRKRPPSPPEPKPSFPKKLAACAGTSGPGHVHLINGLYDANRSYAPVIAIASHIPGSAIGTRYFQKRTPISCSTNAATATNLFPRLPRCRMCCAGPCRPP